MVSGPFRPLPPGRFSTMTGWPSCLDASSAILRRCISVEPPAGQGQISVIARFGKFCALAAVDATASNAQAAIDAVLSASFIQFPSSLRHYIALPEESHMLDAYIYDGIRSPIGRHAGAL